MNIKKKTVIALATLLVMGQWTWAQTTSFTVTAGVEEGTEEKPFLIEDIADLNALANDVNSGTAYEGIYFKLTTDLDYDGKTFTPVGTGEESGEVDTPFKGIFDGNGHTISNITYYNEEGVGVGLFGFIYSPAQIRNINLKNCSFTGNAYVGAIVGNSAGTATGFGVYNCTVESSVSVTSTSTDEENAPDIYVGGIIGYCGNLIIQDCTSAASVSGSTCVGGISGLLYEGTIQDCFYTGNSTFTEETTGVIAGDRGGYDEDDHFISGSEGTISLTLYDNDSEATVTNAMRLGYYNGVEDVDVTLNGRSLLKTGDWNTLCLPFALSAEQIADSPLTGTTTKELDNSASGTSLSNTGELTLKFSTVTAIEAGVPFIVRWGTTGDNITNPVFTGVTISSTEAQEVTSTDTNVKFVGQYSPFAITNDNINEILFVGTGNKIGYSKNARTLKSCRAHFWVQPNGGAGARSINIDFGEGETTGIKLIDHLTIDDLRFDADAWYDMQGRRLSGQPTAKGLYIVKGKTVMVK